MSYDLVVWSHAPRTVKDADAIYQRLCVGDTSLLQPEPDAAARVRAFVTQLTKHYPPMSAYADDDIDDCPWNSEFSQSEVHIVMTLAYSRASEASPFIAALADRCGLVYYDPQMNGVRLPRKTA